MTSPTTSPSTTSPSSPPATSPAGGTTPDSPPPGPRTSSTPTPNGGPAPTTCPHHSPPASNPSNPNPKDQPLHHFRGLDPDTSGKTLAKWRKGRCLQLALAGHSYDEIALEVGYQNRGTAGRAVQDSLSSRIAEVVKEYRELEVARLDALQAAHWPRAVSGSVRAA